MDAPKLKRRRFNWVISDFVRRALTKYYEWSARLRGQRFACRALAGESEYNLTINCDLTVSCNCQDYNGSGHIGDLNKNTFKEVFFGPVAQKFRTDLAKGKLPIMSCTRCGDLMRVPKSQVAVDKEASHGAQANGIAEPGLYAGSKPRLPYRGI